MVRVISNQLHMTSSSDSVLEVMLYGLYSVVDSFLSFHISLLSFFPLGLNNKLKLFLYIYGVKQSYLISLTLMQITIPICVLVISKILYAK